MRKEENQSCHGPFGSHVFGKDWGARDVIVGGPDFPLKAILVGLFPGMALGDLVNKVGGQDTAMQHQELQGFCKCVPVRGQCFSSVMRCKTIGHGRFRRPISPSS